MMIAIARSWGIPSRYVSGYLHLEGAAGEQTPAGASHSWAEFLLPGLDWIGIDSTNNTLADHSSMFALPSGATTPMRHRPGELSSVAANPGSKWRVTVADSDEPVTTVELRAERPNLCNATPTSRTPQAGSDQ